jgi:prepilin-type N-terminal cleavage/methylation domain-containing protein
MNFFKHNPLPFYKKTNESGFTLIELAVVIVIVGIIISIMATVLPSLIQSAKIKKTQAILEKMDYSLEGYIVANGRCPCPDTDGDGIENRIPGASPPTDDTCSSYVGDIPYVTLGLSLGNDAWGNRLKYGVYDDFIRTTKSGLCTSLSSFIAAPFDNSKLYTTDQSGNDTNQAYVTVSGGPKDLDNDGSDVFFDGLNEGTDIQFDDPNRIEDHVTYLYDDLMRATSFTYLYGKNCTGGGGGGGGGGPSGVENTDALCSDTIDNDGDGKIDCHDQDCCGSGVSPSICPDGCPPPDDVKITTTPDPITDGIVGQTNYSHTFQATGGSGYYYWYLDSITPAISELSMNLWSGNLSGTINVCEGAYTVNVRAEDRYDSSRTDSHPFTLNVNNGTLSISPAPNGLGETNPDFTVNSSTFSQVFTASGPHVGVFNWSLSWVGTDPGGFQVNSDDGKFWKSSSTTEGTYTFTLTATDSICSTNKITTNSYTIKITPEGAGAPYTEGMEAEWRFDECATWDGVSYDVVDSLGDINHYGKASGGVAAIHSGKICRAASFDGSDDKIMSDVLTDSDIIVFNDEVTLACWFKSPGGGGSYPRLIEFSDAAGSSSWSTSICYDTDGSLRAWVSDQTSGMRGGTIDYSIEHYNDNKWHHAVYTYKGGSGGSGKLYVDGVLKQTNTSSLTSNIHDAETFVIGGYYPDSSNGFRGLIDEVMVFHREFTSDEVTDLYNMTRSSCDGSCYNAPIGQWNMDESLWGGVADEVKDSSGNNLDGYAQNGATTTTNGKVCRAGDITGATQGVIIPDDNLLDFDGNPFTIAFWYWLNQASTGNWDQIFVKGNGSSRNYAMWMRNGSSGLVLMSVDPGNQYFYSVSTLTTGKWYFINAVHENGNLDMYITESGNPLNWESRRSVTMSGTGDNNDPLYIGRSPNYATIQAKIDQFVLYDRALAENELTALMNASDVCPPEIISISTTSLPNGIINSPYSATVTATGGTTPYGWEIVDITPSISGLSIITNPDYTGTLQGTTNVCAGNYAITLKVTDAAAGFDQKDFTLTVANGTLTISPAPSGSTDFTCTSSTFYQDFTVSGPMLGDFDFDNTVTWLVDPGGFELLDIGTNTVRFRKIDTSGSGNYSFKITGQDSTCATNTLDSGYYSISISGNGQNKPYYYGIVAEWRMDECTWESAGDVKDGSSNNLDGNPNGNAETTSFGKICRAGVFNGTDAYVAPPDASELDITGDISVSLWFYPHDLDSNLLSNRYNFSGNEWGYHLQTLADGTVVWSSHDGATNANAACVAHSTGKIALSQWNHIVVTKPGDSTTVNFYINGVSAGSDTVQRTAIAYSGSYTARRIGAGTISYTYTGWGGVFGNKQYTDGKIDEFMIYSRVLDSDDIQTLYTLSPLCPDTDCYTAPVVKYMMEEASWGNGSEPYVQDSIGSYHGTAYNGATTVDDSGCKAGNFDSTQNQYVNCDNIPISGNTTVSCWLNTSAQQEVPFHKDHCFTFIIRASGDISYADSSNWSYANFGDHGIDFIFGEWNHIVVSKTGSTVRIYRNGDLKLTRTFGSAITSNSNNVYIGSYNGASNYYDGLIDEVIMWNRGLSESTIKKMYEAGRCAD